MGRSLLLLQPEASRTDLRSVLASAGWETTRVYQPAEAAQLDPTRRCAVGIVVIDETEDYDPSDLFAAVSATDTEWVALTTSAVSRDSSVARVLANGFFDFHTLPLDTQRLLHSIGHAFGKAMLRRNLDHPLDTPQVRHGMVGVSPPMLKLYRTLDRVAGADDPLLIQGESGTGKEVAALAVHGASRKARGPFITVNCGAIPLSLVQTELFGHEKGAFTGAHRRTVGSIEAANGGTIFLDEVGDLPLEAQANLLRFLQESTITRVGSHTPIRVDTRVIAASHVDLDAAVRNGSFREDLYYRLNVLRTDLPPLRARGDDIRLIAESVFDAYGRQRADSVQGFSPEAVQAMLDHAWPGNVRELINRVRKAMIMCEGRFIMPSDLGLGREQTKRSSTTLAKARQLSERQAMVAVLERNGHNMAAAARELGVSRVTLYRLGHRLGIHR